IRVAGYEGDFGHWTTLAGWYANLALGCIGVGFAVGCLTYRPGATLTQEAAAALAARNLARLRNLGIGLCFACLIFLLIGIAQVGNLLQYSRNQLFFSGMDIRGLALFNWFGPSAAIAMVITARTARQRGWSYVLGAVALAIYLLSGNRSMALFPLLVGVVIWVKIGRRFPVSIAAGLVLSVLLIIPVIGALRTLGTYDKVSFGDISRSSERASVSLALAELGGSAGVLAITLQYVPAEDQYRYGSTYLTYLRQMVPNVGGMKDVSESPQAVLAESGSLTAALQKFSPSIWATVRVLGVTSALYGGQGVGFSGIAEPYFNFGFGGVVVFFLGAGVFFARMEAGNLLLNFRWLVFSTLFYWFFIGTVRNEFGTFTKPAAFILVTLGIWWVVRRFTPFARA
ncbi:MAG: O-antigen polysaccharide polymerase Wzy, partial [Gammaproteobacteria bacterium]|nr:O-antigen polysaccharide polymerase Wzy [Gammaproteobacteria bacterium]